MRGKGIQLFTFAGVVAFSTLAYNFTNLISTVGDFCRNRPWFPCSQIAALKNGDTTAEQRFEQAKQYYANKNRPRAEEEAKSVIILSPTHKEARKLLGTCYGEDRNFESAATEYQEACNIDPNDMKARLCLAGALEKMKETKEARRVYAFVLKHPLTSPQDRETAKEGMANLSQ